MTDITVPKTCDPAKLKEAVQKIEELLDLEAEKTKTLRQLKRCLQIAVLLEVHPDEVKDVRLRHIQGKSVHKPWRDAKVRVEWAGSNQSVIDTFLGAAGVSHQEFRLVDVPIDLWPAEIAHRYNSYYQPNRKTRSKVT